MIDQCTNPLCDNAIKFEIGSSWRRTPKKFCCDECKTDVWALRKAADLLSSVTPDKKLEILESVLSQKNGREINGHQHGINMDNQREFNGVNEFKINTVRRYSCHRWPRLRIGGKVQFLNGFFSTDNPELIGIVEGNIAYGAQILHVEKPKQ